MFFYAHDVNKDGELNFKEFSAMIKSMKLKLSLEEITELFDRADTDGKFILVYYNSKYEISRITAAKKTLKTDAICGSSV